MKSKATLAKAGDFVLPRMSPLALALGLACATMGAQASTTWVETKTQAHLVNVHTLDSTGADVTADKVAVDMQAGEAKKITVSLNLRNEADLDKFLEAVHTPGNALYHQYLTPEQFAAKYSPTQEQVEKVVAHLTKSGFRNIQVSSNRTLITADGTVATVKEAFNTNLKTFSHHGRQVFANDRVAQVPAELGEVVGSVLGLQNASMHRPLNVIHQGTLGHGGDGSQAASSGSGSETTHNPTALPGIYNAVTTPVASNAVVGTIAAGSASAKGAVGLTVSDFATFIKNNPSLPQTFKPTVVSVPNTGTPNASTSASGEGEWALDTQTIYGAGQPKQLIIYTAGSMADADLTATYNAAVTANVASAVNVSLGECEADAISSGSQSADDKVFKQAVAQGITFSVSSGDAGPYNCDVDNAGSPGVANTTTKRKKYDVSEPASSPYVIAVGGTALFTTSSGAYSGQAVWNEGVQATGDGTGSSRLWASGGGFSSDEAAPSWQTAAIVGSGHTTRGLPDLVFNAAYNSGVMIYLSTGLSQIGGTSEASPIFVGFWARLESAHGNNLGFPASAFYKSLSANTSLVFPVTSATVDGDSVEYNGWSSTYPGMKANASGWSAATGFGSLNVDAVNAYITANPSVFPAK
jgi:pseudomonalisin